MRRIWRHGLCHWVRPQLTAGDVPMSNSSKLGPNSVWLFSLVTLGLAIALTYVVPRITGPMTPKAFAATYFVVFGAGSMAATFLSSASAWRSVGAYAVGSVGLG